MHPAHFNLTVADVDRSVAFYRRWFAFTGPSVHHDDGTVTLRDDSGFDLAFQHGDPVPAVGETFHFGFRADDAAEVRDLRSALVGAGVELLESYDETDFVNAKIVDPDGYVVEIYWDGPATARGSAPG